MNLTKQIKNIFTFNKTSDEYQKLESTPYKRGFDRRINTKYMGTPTYGTAETRTFTLSPKAGTAYFEFWAGGKRFEKTSAESLACPDVTGTYYWYFDTDGVLQVALNGTIDGDTFATSAICGMAYYNKEALIFEGAVDEQHGVNMSGDSHLYLHLTQKFKWANGGEIDGLVDGASTYNSISESVHFDEDIANFSPASTQHSFMYREGNDENLAGWVFSTPDNNIGFKNGGSYVVYNEWNGSNWVLTQSNFSTDYIIYLFGKTNLITHKYVKVVGQQVYSSRSSAREGLLNSLKAIKLQGFPSAEFEWQFAYICKRDGTLEDDGLGNAYIDLRGRKIETLSN